MRLVFMGPPGGGKGTQAQRVLKDAKAVQISTGDELRAAVAAGTPAGKKAQAAMSAGKLVSDEIVNEVLKDRMMKPDAKEGWILDGFPRTVGQAEALDGLLSELGQKIEKVVLIDVWFLGCPPCVERFPHMVELHRQRAYQGLVVMSVNVQESELKKKEKVLAFLSKHGATFPNFIFKDDAKAVDSWQRRNGARYTPGTVVFNRAGERVPVPEDAPPEDIEAIVARLLAD